MGSPERGCVNTPFALLDRKVICCLCFGLGLALIVGGFAISEGYSKQDEGEAKTLSSWDEETLTKLDGIRPHFSNERNIVSASESGDWVLDTEVGDIEIERWYMPSELPLFISPLIL